MTAIRGRVLAVCVCITAAAVGCKKRTPSQPVDPPPTAAAVTPPGQSSADPPLVTITPQAAAVVDRHVADLKQKEKLHLRVRVVPGGCQGYRHKLDLDTEVSAADQVCTSEGVSIVTFRRQADMLRGARIDFGEEDGAQGFKVDNPNFKGDWTRKWLATLKAETDVR